MAGDPPPNSTDSTAVQRLGKNIGRYLGETIQIEAVLREIDEVAQQRGWRSDCLVQSEPFCIPAYHRPAQDRAQSLYISAGIHGDEPAGPLAVLELLRANPWPENLEVWLCPCLNPTGFPLNKRENASGLDLNRQYHQPEALETRSHMAWLEQQPHFNVTLSLHEDWESQGFYVYELSLDRNPTFAEEIVRRVAEVCPIDMSPLIEGREAHHGIIRPNSDPTSRPQWPEAFYLITHKTRVSCTLEAPSDFPLPTRVAALVAGVRAVLEKMAAAPRVMPHNTEPAAAISGTSRREL
jgi:protein MpaA